MTEPTLKQWKRRALAAQEELATIQKMRQFDAAQELKMARENAALVQDASRAHRRHISHINQLLRET